MLSFLSRPLVLLVLMLLTLGIGASFRPVQDAIGTGPMLDFIWSGAQAQARLDLMSQAQRQAHLVATLVNDTAYPLAYGGLLAGLAARFGGSRRLMAVAPALATVVLDLAENGVQAIGLLGHGSVLAAKSVLTPLKFGGFAFAVIVAAALAGAAAIRMISNRNS